MSKRNLHSVTLYQLFGRIGGALILLTPGYYTEEYTKNHPISDLMVWVQVDE